MLKPLLIALCLLLFICATTTAQQDSTLESLQQLPLKYISHIDSKVDKYSRRITSKTIKTLEKLSRWESKIKNILEKAHPDAAKKLFENGQLSFKTLLQKIKEGDSIVLKYQHQYDQYRDNLTTGLKYLGKQKEVFDSGVIKKLTVTYKKMQELNKEEDKNEAIQQFIKERKKQLLSTAFQYIGKSRYLTKINKEAWYYAETIRNFRSSFETEDKAEQTVKGILNTIPAFQKFLGQNSQLSGIFASPFSFSSFPTGTSVPIVNGLPNRAALQNFIQTNIPAATTNPVKQLQLPQVKDELTKWQNKLNEAGGMGNNEMPDFVPNTQRTQPFKKRLVFGTDVQFKSSDYYLPASASIAAKVGFLLNDKSSIGIGLNYVLGMGEGWNKIHFSNNGIGLRTYLKWRIKKGLDIQGGSEWDHLKFKNVNELKNKNNWKQAALLGISKSYTVSKKVKGNIQILYNFLHNNSIPLSPAFIFRFGYELK